MTNRHTLKFSLIVLGIVAFCLPVVANAQWGRQDRYPDDRYGRYDDRSLRDSVHRLDRLAKDFERDMDRALDRSRVNGTRREDQINEQVHEFRDAVGDLKSRIGNGRDLNRSADEARRVLEQAQMMDRVARPRWFDGRMVSQWSQIQHELRFISDVYGFRYNGGYGRYDDRRRRNDRRDDDWRRNDRRDDDWRRNDRRDDDWRRNDRNNRDDWWRRIPFPR